MTQPYLYRLMSGVEFFQDRYEQLGWQPKKVALKQAIRFNQRNAEGKDLVDRLSKLGVHLEKIDFLDDGYWVANSRVSVGATAEYLLGFYSVQEAAAQIPVTLFSKLSNKRVLDACAAPGGKTVQLADVMNNTGLIVALDIKKDRLVALANHLERCQVKNTIVYVYDARQASNLKMKFDRILLDVPCSGNFVTDDLWFKRRTFQDVEHNAKIQRDILSDAVKCLADDGEIVYSTCSLEPEEDEMNIDWAIKNLDLQTESINCIGVKGLSNVLGHTLDVSVENSRRIWPGQTQGFFVCKLKKRQKL